MLKTIIGLFISTVFLASCSTTNLQFGQVEFEFEFEFEGTERTQEITEEILEIKNLDNTIFDTASFKSTEWDEINYALFKPSQQKPNKTYPLVVVFHGSAEIGNDNIVTSHILGDALPKWLFKHTKK
jgi:acetyl esterase/lipase